MLLGSESAALNRWLLLGAGRSAQVTSLGIEDKE